jgi:hypothetical protein
MSLHFDEIKRLLIEESLSQSEIVKRYSHTLSAWQVKRLIQEAYEDVKKTRPEFQMRRAPSGFKPLGATKTLSQMHLAIGVRLNNHRRVEMDMQPMEYCSKFNFSNHIRLRKMETGQYDFSLSEMQRISEIVGIPMEELVTPFIRNAYAC